MAALGVIWGDGLWDISVWDQPIWAQAGEDGTPDAFTFTDQTDAALGSTATSAPITVAGLGTGIPAAISVSGGQYSINGGSFTSSPGTVVNGDEVRARVTASGSYSTGVTATVTIGGISDGFTATTRATPDTTPDAFSFTDQTGVELNAVVVSAPVTVAGIETGFSAAISVSVGEYNINGGVYTSSPGTVSTGDVVRARITASSAFATVATSTVTIGGVSDGFAVTTRAQTAPTITTTTLSNAHVGSPYSRTPAATGDGPFTWDITAGALPTGLSLNAGTGAITGTPTTEETGSFTLRATNDAGNDTQALSILVLAATVDTARRTGGFIVSIGTMMNR
jgi:hypothetical protein